MKSLLHSTANVQDTDECIPDPDQWAEACAVLRAAPQRLSSAEWLAGQIAYWRSEHALESDPGDYALLISGELLQLHESFSKTKSTDVAELGQWSTRYSRLIGDVRLDKVRVPGVWEFESPLGLDLSERAALYLSYHYAHGDVERDTSRLAGAVLLRLARDVERMGSTTAEGYLLDEAAMRAAEIDAICEMIGF